MKIHRLSFRHKTDTRHRVQSISMLMLLLLTLFFNCGLANADHPCTCPPPSKVQQANPAKEQADCDAICNDWPLWIPASLKDACDPTITGNPDVTIDTNTISAATKVATDGEHKYGAAVGFALYDSSGKRASYHETNINYGASITKAMLLVAYLNQPNLGTLSAQATDQLTKMITQSDNVAANWVYANIKPDAAAAVNAVAAQAQMSSFKLDTTDSTYILGQSQITSDDFAKFFSNIDILIPDAYKSFTLGNPSAPGILTNLSAADQKGLLLSGLPKPVYSKEGWKAEPAGAMGTPYIVNQAAQFTDGIATYGVAVTVSGIKDPKSPNDPVKDKADGEQIIQDIVSALVKPNTSATQSQGSSCCSSTSSSSSTGSPTTNGGTTKGNFSIDQVKTFASEPITSTWNISNGAVEQWFLKQAGAQATVSKYGLNSSNIGAITSAIVAAKVSPVFFYLYTVNEGGGAGGFINHYTGDTSGGGPGNATRDAQYLVSASNTKQFGPATGGGEPGNMPTAEAKQILDALPLGSVGVVYIQATSAVTAELETLSGKGPVNSFYGKPLSDSMSNIKTMGGDPLQGGSAISAGGCTTNSVTGAGLQKGISFAIFIAKNNGYGYDQPGRASGWAKYQSDPSCKSQCGSFDCSSFVSAILTVAGYFSTNPEFATGNEAAELTGAGFKKIAGSATTSAGLQQGDIMLWSGHTEMYIGNDQAVAAHINENGGVAGGQVGDQTGREISVESFQASLSSDPWIGVYRASK